MKAYLLVLASSLGAAAVAATGLSLLANPASMSSVQTDALISGGIPQPAGPKPSTLIDAAAVGASPPAIFSVSNFTRRSVCLVERGGTLTSRSRSFFAPPDCAAVWPGLQAARTWTENEDGSVTLSDGAGKALITLVRGKSFSYEMADPREADLALLMLP